MPEPVSGGSPALDFAALDGETMLQKLHEVCAASGASDIHFSPQKTTVRLEWRLHGVLLPVAQISHDKYVSVVRRVKFLAKLKLNLTNVPQDGQYTFQATDKDDEGRERSRTVNVRTATLPSRFGEAITLRLLDPKRGIIPLEKLGFPMDIKKKLEELVELPNGLILVTGPTGSGKTTTLYALLSTIVGKERNIITLEDPVEYELEGIIQSQIDADHDFTFATGLRSVLRHDPDVVLVGEIRDAETAQTAINAALTGHLVLSTLHTNSAIEAIPRLLSMGVSPYTFAPALRAVLAQRLVRTLKDSCKAGPCDPAAHDSYDGQMSLPELLMVGPSIQQLILNLEQGPQIEAQARKEGFKSMKEWGREFVQEKKTTELEVSRVTA
ncbi:type II/IV secretion system protein [Candidatus Peregrinibacteria bacterium]|nr:type II/IV secretion system protein [Candidatus Peregrinibacteria bacterium]